MREPNWDAYLARETARHTDGGTECEGVEVELSVERDGVDLLVAVAAGDDTGVIVEPTERAGVAVVLTRAEQDEAWDRAAERMRDEEDDARELAAELRAEREMES